MHALVQIEANVPRLRVPGGMDVVDELVRRSRAGDRAAFAQLYRDHRAAVARLVFRMTGYRAPEVEDVVQEVFLQAYRSLGNFQGQAKFSTWLHRVAMNVILMTRRAQRKRPSLSDQQVDSERSADSRILPDDDAARRRRVEAFRNILDKIPDKKRAVYILHDIEGMPPTEIAAMVDAPVLTVRTRLFYARREIIKLMKRDPILCQVIDEIAADMRQSSDNLSPVSEEES